MRPAPSHHGGSGTPTHGKPNGHRRHDILSPVFYGGRRRRVFTRLVAESGARPGDRVLDIGCGTGYFTRLVARAVAPGGAAHGVDSDGEVIEHAQRLTPVDNCSFSEGSAEALDAPDGAYTVVVSSLMIHHLPEALRRQAISEMFRVLRQGGTVLIAEFRPPASRIGRRLVAAHSPAMAANRVDQLEPLLLDAGFEQFRSGDLRPWTHFVRARKPRTAGDGANGTTA